MSEEDVAAYRGLAPGWFRDATDPTLARYWDGDTLSEERRPIGPDTAQESTTAQPPAPPASPSPGGEPQAPLAPPAAQSPGLPSVEGSQAAVSYNQLHRVSYRGGIIGLLAGENQIKALQRAIPQLNASGLRVVAAVVDRWSIWKRLGYTLLLIVTLFLVGRVPNIILITEPIEPID